MKTISRFFSFLVLILTCFLFSCSDNDNISDKKLLPSQIIQNYRLTSSSPGVSVETINKYTYDDSNRLEKISHTYTATEGSERIVNTRSTLIKYDAESRVSEVHITTSENSAIGVVSIEKYTYSGDKITRNKDGKDIAIIQASDKNIQVTDLIVGESQSSTNYQLDINGNVIEYRYTSDYSNHRRYNFDQKNGIFKQVNTPKWFLITQSEFLGYQSENRTKEFVASDDNWVEFTYNEMQYNNDDYPVIVKKIPSPGWIGASSTTMTVEYIQATAVYKNE